jgi:hypothetical protein
MPVYGGPNLRCPRNGKRMNFQKEIPLPSFAATGRV